MPSFSDLLASGAEALKAAGLDNPRRDARLLLSHCADCSTAQLIGQDELPVSKKIQHQFWDTIRRRAEHEPVSRIIGKREFWGRTFAISPDVLDPRADTETLVEWALGAFPEGADTILDLGVGSGCILLTLLSEWRNSRGVGADLSPQALKIAKDNAGALDVESRVKLVESNWFSNIAETSRFDLIISNPPYIPTRDLMALDRDVREYDPMTALDGGKDGLDDYRSIISTAKTALKPCGFLGFEVGFDQADIVQRLMLDAGFDSTGFCKDLSGIKRVVYGRASTV